MQIMYIRLCYCNCSFDLDRCISPSAKRHSTLIVKAKAEGSAKAKRGGKTDGRSNAKVEVEVEVGVKANAKSHNN